MKNFKTLRSKRSTARCLYFVAPIMLAVVANAIFNIALTTKAIPELTWITVNISTTDATNAMTGTTNKAYAAFRKMEIFVTTFPGGFWELNSTALRTLKFFWPPEEDLNVLVVLDNHTKSKLKAKHTAQVKSYATGDRHRVRVEWNPRTEKRYGSGWYIQQLVMFWADNFTDAEYVAIIDDDTLFTKAILPTDLFDGDGRPRVVARYNTGKPRLYYHDKFHKQSTWAITTNHTSYINAMSYFPVIIKREHFHLIRDAMLRARTHQNAYFDEIFARIVKRGIFSQFMMMFDYLWLCCQDEYSWHLEDYHKNKGKPFKNKYMRIGRPEVQGGTVNMTRPFHRVAMHANYQKQEGERNPTDKSIRDEIVSEAMRNGYCYSQPIDHDTHLPPVDKRCESYNVWDNVNAEYEWNFEDLNYGTLWPEYDPKGVLEAHQNRMLLNQPRRWDPIELDSIFNVSSKAAS